MWRRLPVILVLSAALFSAPCAESRGRHAGLTATAAAAPQQAALPVWSLHGTIVRDAIDAAEDGSDDQIWDQVRAFYTARGDQPAWTSEAGREAGRVLLDGMARADEDGLDPARYEAPLPPAPASEEDLPRAATADVALTAAVLRFGRDLALGSGHTADEDRAQAIVDTLADARDGPSARAAVAALEPAHPEYHQLRHALREYRAIAARASWEPLPDDILLRQERARFAGHDAGDILRRLCLGLVALGDLPDDPGRCLTGDVPSASGFEEGGYVEGAEFAGENEVVELAYDGWLEDGVRRFQERHGLVVDGIVGPQTIGAFNVPPADRVAQITRNMDRWRQLPPDLGSRHVRVNIPAFRIYAVDDGERALEMRAIVGRLRTRTPVMSDEISYLELRPYWNVPDALMRRDLLPRILEDPSYIDRMGFDVIDGWGHPPRIVDPATVDWARADELFPPYRLRQRPGRRNSMGLVKFMFPNQHHVYLHDTPSAHLFERRPRAFSAGCVRVEDPVALADFLLQEDPAWYPASIERAMDQGSRRVVNLAEPVPVHLTYFTAFVDDSGVAFRADLYGHDGLESGGA